MWLGMVARVRLWLAVHVISATNDHPSTPSISDPPAHQRWQMPVAHTDFLSGSPSRFGRHRDTDWNRLLLTAFLVHCPIIVPRGEEEANDQSYYSLDRDYFSLTVIYRCYRYGSNCTNATTPREPILKTKFHRSFSIAVTPRSNSPSFDIGFAVSWWGPTRTTLVGGLTRRNAVPPSRT